jgi:hypothetical protein
VSSVRTQTLKKIETLQMTDLYHKISAKLKNIKEYIAFVIRYEFETGVSGHTKKTGRELTAEHRTNQQKKQDNFTTPCHPVRRIISIFPV